MHFKPDNIDKAAYDRLRELAANWFQRQPLDHTLQPTALVHEAYVRLSEGGATHLGEKDAFLPVAVTAMRHVLVDHARKRRAEKRGGGRARLSLEDADASIAPKGLDILALDEALQKLRALNERQCMIVELRFLAGLTIDETARVIGCSPRTVKDDWTMARTWLQRELKREDEA